MSEQFTARPFSRAEVAWPEATLLSHGRFGNADVHQYRHGGRDWIIKDFRCRPLPVRNTWGRFLLRREWLALTRLQGIAGLPQDVFRLDRFALCYRCMPGIAFRNARPERTTGSFFRMLESIVVRMHERGVAHLDLRYRHNILVLEDGSPGIIDFQSHIGLHRLPRRVQRLLRNADLAGVYKHWCKRDPDSIDAERIAVLRSANVGRRFWRLKGYGLHVTPRRKQRYEVLLDERTPKP
jgi:predicted Ser/Thr protein kinase